MDSLLFVATALRKEVRSPCKKLEDDIFEFKNNMEIVIIVINHC